MSFPSSFHRSNKRRKARRASKAPARRRLRFETFEDRRMLSLNPAVDYAVGAGPVAVVAADFNNDGQLDLVTANGFVSVLLGADGTFGLPINSPAGYRPKSIAVGDFDNDGNLDLAAVSSYSYGQNAGGAVNVMFGNGNGNFQPPSRFVLNDAYSMAQSVAVGDFNDDGIMDLAVASNGYSYFFYDYSDGHTSVLLSNGDRTFAAPINTFGSLNEVSSVVAADFNDDGHHDLVIGSNTGTSVSSSIVNVDMVRVRLGDGKGNFTDVTNTNWLIEQGTSLAVGDLNGDENTDLVAADYSSVNVRLANGVGGFEPPRGGHSYDAGNNPAAVALGDFNRDGVLDIAAANYESNDVSILCGRGDGAFLPPEHFAVGPAASTVAIADFNRDGVVDTADYVVWRKTGGTPDQYAAWRANFGRSAVDPHPIAVAAGDFNGDGWLDIATANAGGKSVSVLMNDQTWEPLPQAISVSIDNVAMQEGNGNKTTLFVFTVTLSAAADQPVTMSYRTVYGTANNWVVYPTTIDNDYVDKTGELFFATGESTKTITIEVKGDIKSEPDETFYVVLFDGSSNTLFTRFYGIGTILNDD
jgi:hypothetical protein